MSFGASKNTDRNKSVTGNSLIEYALPLVVIVPVLIAAFYTMDMFVDIQGLFGQSTNAQVAGRTMAVQSYGGVLPPADVVNTLKNLPPAQAGQQTLCFRSGFCANMPVINNSNMLVETAGGNGNNATLTKQFSTTMQQFVQQLKDANADQGLINLIEKLANEGHDLATLMEVVNTQQQNKNAAQQDLAQQTAQLQATLAELQAAKVKQQNPSANPSPVTSPANTYSGYYEYDGGSFTYLSQQQYESLGPEGKAYVVYDPTKVSDFAKQHSLDPNSVGLAAPSPASTTVVTDPNVAAQVNSLKSQQATLQHQIHDKQAKVNLADAQVRSEQNSLAVATQYEFLRAKEELDRFLIKNPELASDVDDIKQVIDLQTQQIETIASGTITGESKTLTHQSANTICGTSGQTGCWVKNDQTGELVYQQP